jgi:hypothetical protein
MYARTLLMVAPDSRVNLARRRAEAPLIPLYRFPKPALPERQSAFKGEHDDPLSWSPRGGVPMKARCVVTAIGGNTRRYKDPRRGPLTAEELVENAAAIGPKNQRHTHQRSSGYHARRHWQGELFSELRFPYLEQERN